MYVHVRGQSVGRGLGDVPIHPVHYGVRTYFSDKYRYVLLWLSLSAWPILGQFLSIGVFHFRLVLFISEIIQGKKEFK